MGLDQFAFSFPNKAIVIKVGHRKITIEEYDPQTDFQQPKNSKELQYWRKHPNLHGWMERLYHKKGGTGESFNCATVRLTMEDLNQLENDIKNNNLPDTDGFFFGESNGSEIQEDLKFVYLAKEEIKKGRLIAYTSWW
jgi:hypothetical protein